MTSYEITTNSGWYREKIAPLYCHYDGQCKPQDAYLELDPEDWSIDATYNAEIGTAVPAPVWHGRRFRIPLPYNLSGCAVGDLLEDASILSLVDTIFAGYQERWDGSNLKGVLSDKAQKALEELEQELFSRYEYLDEDDCASMYYVYDWVSESDLAAVTWDTLEDFVKRIEADAEGNGVLILDDVEEYLRNHLEQKDEDEDEDDEDVLCT